MPLKNGHITPRERALARAVVDTGSTIAIAAKHAGYQDHSGAVKALQRPEVIQEIARVQQERLFNEVLPLAVRVHIDVLQNPLTPAAARVQAIKLAYDRTLGQEGAQNAKQPHEMTADELALAIEQARLKAAALESVAADRAKPVIDGQVDALFD